MKWVLIFLCFLAVNAWDLDVSIASNPQNYTEIDTLNATVYQSFVTSTTRIAEIAIWMAYGADLTITLGTTLGSVTATSQIATASSNNIEKKTFVFSTPVNVTPGTMYFIGISRGRIAADAYGSAYQDGNIWRGSVGGPEDLRIDVMGNPSSPYLMSVATTSEYTMTAMGTNRTCNVSQIEMGCFVAQRNFTLVGFDVVNRVIVRTESISFRLMLFNPNTSPQTVILNNLVRSVNPNNQNLLRNIPVQNGTIIAGNQYWIGYVGGNETFAPVACGGVPVPNSYYMKWVRERISVPLTFTQVPQIYLKLYIADPVPLTTSPLTTSPLTSAPLTTSPVTTSPVTSSPLTTSRVTSGSVTSGEITSIDITSGDITTGQDVTTAPLTTSPLTTVSLTTSPLTTSPLTTESLTTSPLTTASITSAEVTTSQLTTSPLSTSVLSSSDISTGQIDVTSAVLSTGLNPETSGLPPVSTGDNLITSGVSPASTGLNSATSGISPLTTGLESVTSGDVSLSTGFDSITSGINALTSGDISPVSTGVDAGSSELSTGSPVTSGSSNTQSSSVTTGNSNPITSGSNTLTEVTTSTGSSTTGGVSSTTSGGSEVTTSSGTITTNSASGMTTTSRDITSVGATTSDVSHSETTNQASTGLTTTPVTTSSSPSISESASSGVASTTFEGSISENINSRSGGSSVGGIAAGIGVAAILLFVVGIILGYIFLKKRNKGEPNKKELQRSRSEVELEERDIGTFGNIEIKKKLGEGTFGDVYLGLWNGTKVALKQLKDKSQSTEFMKEVGTLSQVKHPNCVQFLGLYTSKTNDIFLVTEYLPLGSLSTLLQQNHNLQILDLMNICIGAAKGLAYLEGMGIVHRDVSLRNLLAAKVNEKYTAKVSDFGLSRVIDQGEYEVNSSSKLPVKWTSPEVLMGGSITIKNDVWAFGVTMWEIFSLGAAPFPWLSNKEAFVEIPKGERLPCPDGCPNAIYAVMQKCWVDQASRPSFVMLIVELKALKKELVVNPKMKTIEDPVLPKPDPSIDLVTQKRMTLTSTPYNNAFVRSGSSK